MLDDAMEGENRRHEPNTAAAPGSGNGLPPRPPPPRRPSTSPLSSYVSEPPSTLALMKSYATELLQQQEDAQHQEAASLGDGVRAGRQSSLELPLLANGGSKGPLERPTHFELGPTIGNARRSTLPAETPNSPGRSKLRSSIGWVTYKRSSAEGEVVLEHRVAGDLILPATTARAVAAAPGASPAKDLLRRRPLLRASTHSTGALHLVAGTDQPSDAPQGAASPQKKALEGSDDGKGDDMESLDFEGKQTPWWKKKKLWLIVGPLLVSLAFLLAGTFLLVYNQDQRVGQFQVWRICFFIAGLPVIWWMGRGSMDLAVWGVERTMFTWHNALYYAYAVRRPMANVIRAALTTGWWALMLTAFSGEMNSTLVTWYNNVLKLFGCLTLFMTANLLKVLFAKMLASKFNQHSHYQKMHEALKREYLLHVMLQPRQRYIDYEEEEEGALEGGWASGDEQPVARSKSAPLEHARPEKQHTLAQLFRISAMLTHPSPNRSRSRSPGRPAKNRSRKLSERVLFWRGSRKELHPIDEGEEGQPGASGHGSEAGKDPGLPPGAVAVDINHGGQSMSEGQEEPLPLLDHATRPGTVKTVAGGSTSGGAGGGGGGGGSSSLPASPLKSPSPAKQPVSPLSKLERLRSDALEAVRSASGDLSLAQAVRRLSPDSEALARRQTMGQAAEGSSAGGSGAGISREPSLASRAYSRLRPAVQRAGSVTSARSMRSAQPKAAEVAPPSKALLSSSASTVSSSDSQRHLMALRMSKMEKYIRKHALEVTFKDALSRTERSEQVTSELEARKLGFYLFHNLKSDYDRDHLNLDDFEAVLSERDAKAALDMLDDDGNGQVNVQECCAAIARMFVDRRNLAASLKDARTIVGTLQALIGVFLHILMAFVYLLIWNVDVMKTWAGFASLFLGFSFVFGNSIRTTYENVVFLFVVHPYDVGEVIFINNQQCTIEEIHLSFTVLSSPFGERIWYPNESIRVVPFVNISCSKNKGEVFKVLVDLDTPPSVIDELRSAAESVIKAHPKEFSGAMAVNLSTAESPLKMTIVVWWEYSHTGADLGRMGRHRTKMYIALSETLARLGVRYTWPATADLGHANRTAVAAAGAANQGSGLDVKTKLL